MAMANLTSITSLSQALSMQNHDNLRDVSFSSYLNKDEEAFIHELAESSRIISQSCAQEEHNLLGIKREEEAEIGVFSAEKYFNGVIDAESPRITNMVVKYRHVNKDEQRSDHAIPVKPKVHTGTPSVRSESSWNSQSALLQSVVRNSAQKRTNKLHGKSILAGLGCNCLCSDKNSVDVSEHIGEISFKKSPNSAARGKAGSKDHIKHTLDPELKVRSGSWVREEINLEKLGIKLEGDNCVDFPTSSSASGNVAVKMQIQGEEVKPRKSIEVLGSPVHEKRDNSLKLERRLKMLSWDMTPRMEEIESSTKSSGVYEDKESDASSDLFEIESLTGKVTPFLARQESGTSGCVTPCYAPSEASIEWSIVTASAADLSVMSDYEDRRQWSPIKMFPGAKNTKIGISKEMPRRRPGISLGCNSHRAVKVAGNAYTTQDQVNYNPQMQRVLDPHMPVTRFQVENKLTGFDSKHRHRQHALASPCSQTPPSHGSRLLFNK